MQHQQLPATHNQGSALINGIFVPITLLKHCQTGFLAFGNVVPSDHHAVWIDIPAHCVCPTELEEIVHPCACCLQCKDPHIVHKYKQLLWELHQNRIATRAQFLALETKSQLSQTQQAEYKKIDKATTEYKCYAEKHCRKIHAGVVLWCPQVSQAINCILYWKDLWSWLNGCTISSSVLKQRAKKEIFNSTLIISTLISQLYRRAHI